MEFGGSSATCSFCRRGELEMVLLETRHLYVLVDNAPLTEGHLLIVPKEHLACYGAAPATYDDELRSTKDRVASFLGRAYQSACFFEHGVYRQSVYHAHLHAIPLGVVAEAADLGAEAALAGGIVVHHQDDIRSWYGANGRYFYVEQTPSTESAGVAALFPAEDTVYLRVLARLVAAADRHQPFQPQPVRRLVGRPRMRAVADAWTRLHPSA